MAPTLVREPFHRLGWIYEEKVDGYRMLGYKDGASVRLVSRKGVDHTRRFADLAAAVAKLSARTLVLDGELAVFDQQLRSRFDWREPAAPGGSRRRGGRCSGRRGGRSTCAHPHELSRRDCRDRRKRTRMVHTLRVRDSNSVFALWTSLRRALPLAHRADSLSDVPQVVPPLDGMKPTPWPAVERAAWV